MRTKDLGLLGEELAAKFLQKQGYQILQKNFRSWFGEIDIVALEGNTLVFVEVKTRWSKEYGLPEEAITTWKIRKIIKTGQYFKLLNPKTPELLRIDLVAIEMTSEGKIQRIELIKNISS